MGVLLALASALCYSFSNLLIRKGVRAGSLDNGVLTTVVASVLFFTPLVAAIGLLYGIPEWDPVAVIWFAGAGFCAIFLGRNALYAGIRHLGAARASAIKNTSPLVAVAFGITIFGERLFPQAILGMGLVLLGVFLLMLEAFQRESRREVDGGDALVIGLDPDAMVGAESSSGRMGLASRGIAMMRGDPKRTALAGSTLSALAAISFGSGQALSKAGMELMPNALLGAAIGSWTAFSLYLGTFALTGRLSTMVPRGDIQRYFWLAGLAGSVGTLSFFVALRFAPVSYVAVVVASESVLTVALAAMFLRRLEGVTRQLLLSAILVFVGAVLLALSR